MLQGFVDTTSLHGPVEIYYAKSSLGRCYWSTIFVAMVLIGVYFTYTVIDSFLEAPITTKVSAIEVNYMMLPEVVICYSGIIDAAKLLDNGMSIKAVRALKTIFLQPEFLFMDNTSADEAFKLFDAAKPEMLDFVAKRNISGYDSLLVYASFDCSKLIQKVSSIEEIDYSCNMLRTISHEWFGTCYVLPSIRQNTPFVTTGWHILLKAPLEHAVIADVRYTGSFSVEFAQKYDALTGDSCKLLLNRSAVVALQQTTYNRLQYRKWPRSHVTRCYKSASNDTAMQCANHCHTRATTKTCNCIPYGMRKQINYTTCWPDRLKCDMSSTTYATYYEKCIEMCLPLCDEVTYGITVTYADLAAEHTIRKFRLAGAVQGVTYLQVGYSILRYTSIEEQDTAGLDDCISNVGGMFGLWVGGSIFTIIHLLTTLCNYCRYKTQTTVRRTATMRKWTTSAANNKNDHAS